MGRVRGSLRCNPSVAVLAVVALCACAWPSAAAAAIPASIFHIGKSGSGAGEMAGGVGLAADPGSGHVFLSDAADNRIDEFTAWGEFVKAWGWGVSDGSAELQSCGPAEPVLEPDPSLCRAGIAGEAAGQMEGNQGLALAPDGDLYLFEKVNRRIQVFTRSGTFLFMFGGEVDKTTGADICTAADVAAGDECGAGVVGTGPSEFAGSATREESNGYGQYIAIASDGTVYVADRSRIQEFEADGTYTGEITFASLHASDPAFPEEGAPEAMAVDPTSGDLYLGLFEYRSNTSPAPAFRIDQATATVRYQLPTVRAQSFAVGPAGELYVGDEPDPGTNRTHLLEIDGLGALTDDCCEAHALRQAMAVNTVTPGGGVDLYTFASAFTSEGGANYIDVRGPAPENWPPPKVPPAIEAQQAISVGERQADVAATINPNFWDDTHYHLEYGTAPCDRGGCTATAERPLGAGTVREGLRTETIPIEGLQPGVTYHYRFVAASGGGGPTYGPDRTFTTVAPAGAQAPCPNDAYRTGAGGRLADCRAYELVSPVDKGGGDILVQTNISGFLARLDQAAPSGEALTYSSYRSFGSARSAPFASQYLARRGSTGWSTEGISPPQQDGVYNGGALDSNFKAFSEDLSSGLLVQESEPTLAAGAIPGWPNLYRRDNETGAYEALSTTEPAITPSPQDYRIEVLGASADGQRTVFAARGKLTANAASVLTYQVYENFKGTLRLVSQLPSKAATTANATVGTLSEGFHSGRVTNSATAVSEDGSKIYWSETDGLRRLYVRVNAFKTVPVSSGPATFWAATPDGGEALYEEGGSLKLFSLGTESSTSLVSEGMQGVVGAAKDLSRIYLVSSAALASGARAGAYNLYFYEAGRPLRFVAALSGADFAPELPSPATVDPLIRMAQVSSDGNVAVFASRTALTGADNIDTRSGEPDAEVFRYDAEGGQLLCISCNPTGQAPAGRDMFDAGIWNISGYRYASRIPGWEFQLHAPRVITAGGSRLFFDSLNRLVPADTDEAEDVYEWEAPGTGTCTAGGPGFDAKAGGCVTLVSGGEDVRGSEFVDASSDGRDVFFLTGQGLVGWDPGQVDVYDARAGGGLSAPPPPRADECDGERCQPSGTPPPAAPGNASEAVGAGNQPRLHCRKGTLRRHGHCVRRRHGHRHHRRHASKHRARKGAARGHHRGKGHHAAASPSVRIGGGTSR